MNVKPLISVEELNKIDVRVGRIVAVEDVADSDNLIVLKVSFGAFDRQIVVGMKKEREDPGEVAGMQALFVVNIAPRLIRGTRSEGMLFDIGYPDGVTPVLAVPEREVPDGTRAG